MMFLKRLLHMIPFVHFYAAWEDINSPNANIHWHQKRRCVICNRGQKRCTDSNPFL